MIELNNLRVSFLFFGSVFYINYFILKPVYIILGLLVFFGYMSKKYILNYSYLISSYFFVIFLFFVSLMMKTDIGMVFNAILSILVFPIYLYYCRENKGIQVFTYFLNLCCIYFLIEVVYRVSFPVYRAAYGVEEEWFYPYKINSFIFQDSNFVALHLFCLLYISIVLKLNRYVLFFLVLIFLTFSRSAILGGILAYLYFLSINTRYVSLIKPIFYLSTISFFIYLIINIDMITDGSFLSKLYILNSAIYYAENNFSVYQYLFGNGLSQTFDTIGIGAHNILVILLFETGIIGTIVYLTYFFNFFFLKVSNKSCKSNLFVFLGLFFLMGFSLGLYLFPIMVLTIAVILSNAEGKNGQ